MQTMLRTSPATTGPLSGSLKNSIFVAVVGAIGLLAIMQWTAYSVRRHVKISSFDFFPAALDSQRAGAAFEKMNRGYSDAVLMQEDAALPEARREAATVVSELNSAAASMSIKPERSQQIVALERRVIDLEARSSTVYARVIQGSGELPTREQLALLSRDNDEIRAALETLQRDLANDFRAELALINELLWIQEMLEYSVLFGVVVALFFSVRSLINATVRMREATIVRQADSEKESERNMLRALIDNIPDLMYVKDSESKFVVANAQLARAVGVKSPDQLLGLTDFDIFPIDIANAFYKDDQNVIRLGKPLYNREEYRLDSGGKKTYLLTTKMPLRDSDGLVTGIAGVGRDITERKKMEDALREAERKYRGIFDDAVVGIFQSAPDGRLLSVNPSMASTFGYHSPDEMLANVTDVFRECYVDPAQIDEVERLLSTFGGLQNCDGEVIRADGEKIWVSMSVRPVHESGKVVRREGMCVDITERKLLREQLLQAQKLESVGQLAAGIAHEINTPIQYIGDNVRFLQESFVDITSVLAKYETLLCAAKSKVVSAERIREVEEALAAADTVYLVDEIPKAIGQTLDGITRVSMLVSAMKEFSHPGKKEKVLLDLNHAIETTITLSRNEWRYVADLEFEFDSTLPMIPCLPGEFNQVILNLIVNAAHAVGDVVPKGSSEKGRISVRTRNCPEWAEIRIQDTGCGIRENIRTRIFDPFFTTKEIGKGTGQGLAIARSVVVDKHGGTIHFETEVGRGTTFIIRLPRDVKEIRCAGVVG